MNTTVVTVDKEHPDRKVIERAGQILKSGGLVAFPTETVYGLGGDGLNPSSSQKIYQAKGRPSDNPLIIHIADLESLDKIVKKIPPKAQKMAEAFWPGPLTMIFEKSSLVPYETTGGLESVAVRMPSHPVARALIRAAGVPTITVDVGTKSFDKGGRRLCCRSQRQYFRAAQSYSGCPCPGGPGGKD